MKKILVSSTLLVLVGVWWVGMAPPDHLKIGMPIIYSDKAVKAAQSNNYSKDFAEQLELLPSELPGHDDVIFLEGENELLVSAMDGKIWKYNYAQKKAEIFIDTPLMAAGLHESSQDKDELFFCASHLWGDTYPENERVGLYRLHMPTKVITPIVLNVPISEINGPKVWSLSDPKAPRLSSQASTSHSRPLAFCNDLEVTQDGKRIYFSEPFSYVGASMGGGTIQEVLAANGNGRIWHHDLETGETRLVVQGFHFLDGILYDLHPDGEKEESILASLTPEFRLMRFYVSGEKATTAEVVQEGLPGMCDGLDRDSSGNIWCALFAQRSPLITWLHGNPWAKEILVRLPLKSLPPPKETGVMALNSDASEILYFADYSGPKASQIASAIPGPDGFIYMTPFSRTHRGLVRLPNPLVGTAR